MAVRIDLVSSCSRKSHRNHECLCTCRSIPPGRVSTLSGYQQCALCPERHSRGGQLTGHPINVRIENVGNRSLLLRTEQRLDALAILQWARKLCRQRGVVSVRDIHALLPDYRLESVRIFIDSLSGVNWLDCDKDWFYLEPKTNNRLTTALKKIFSVTVEISQEDLHAAIKRVYIARRFVPPPLPIVLAFSAKVLNAKCADGTVSLAADSTISSVSRQSS